MDKFEEYIKARYPVDYEHLKEKYPNVPVGEFYVDEKDLWNYRQAELDQQKLLTRDSELHLDAAKEEIERLKGVVDERYKLIEAALSVLKGLKAENDLWGCDQVEVQIEILEKALRGEHE